MRITLICGLCGGTRILRIRSYREVQHQLKRTTWCGPGDHSLDPSAWGILKITNVEIEEDDDANEILRVRRNFLVGRVP